MVNFWISEPVLITLRSVILSTWGILSFLLLEYHHLFVVVLSLFAAAVVVVFDPITTRHVGS